MKEVKNFPNYVISIDAKIYKKSKDKLVEIKQSINRKYYSVKLSNKGERKHCFVHRLLAEAYIPNPENKNYVNHKDGNKLNNNVENLEWVTFAENIQHSFQTGLNKGLAGEENGKALLNEDQVIKIYEKLLSGEKSIDIAKEFGVNRSTIGNIKRKRLWKHVTDVFDDIPIKPKSKRANEAEVHEICKMLELGLSPNKISEELQAPINLVYDIKRRRGFRDITSLYEW